MAKRFYTVLILSEPDVPARTFHISACIVVAASAVTAAFLLTFAYCLYQYMTLSVPLPELKLLRQQVPTRSLAVARVSQLESDLAKLRGLDRQVRRLAGLDGRSDQDSRPAPDAPGISRQAASRAAESKSPSHQAVLKGSDLEALGEEIIQREQGFRELQEFLERERALLASMPSIWPARGLLTSGYGYRASPFTGEPEMHKGVDIAAPLGTPILAAADGVVSFAGFRGNYGNMVLLNHGQGVETLYAHASTIVVRVGQWVKRGQIIARIGISGLATGPHVLYEVLVDGAAVNPLKYLFDPTEVKVAGAREADLARSNRSTVQLRAGG